MDQLWNIFLQMAHGNGRMESHMLDFPTILWTWRRCCEGRKETQEKKGGRQRGREKENRTSQFEKALHLYQQSTSEIFRVKRNIFSSMSRQHKASVMGLEICGFRNLSLLLMNWLISESLKSVTWGYRSLPNFHCYFEDQVGKCFPNSQVP